MSAQSSKKKRIGSRRHKVNQSEASQGSDGFHTVAQAQMPQKDDIEDSEALIGSEHLPVPHETENQTNIGFSLPKQESQGEESVESQQEPTEEVVEHAQDSEALHDTIQWSKDGVESVNLSSSEVSHFEEETDATNLENDYGLQRTADHTTETTAVGELPTQEQQSTTEATEEEELGSFITSEIQEVDNHKQEHDVELEEEHRVTQQEEGRITVADNLSIAQPLVVWSSVNETRDEDLDVSGATDLSRVEPAEDFKETRGEENGILGERHLKAEEAEPPTVPALTTNIGQVESAEAQTTAVVFPEEEVTPPVQSGNEPEGELTQLLDVQSPQQEKMKETPLSSGSSDVSVGTVINIVEGSSNGDGLESILELSEGSEVNLGLSVATRRESQEADSDPAEAATQVLTSEAQIEDNLQNTSEELDNLLQGSEENEETPQTTIELTAEASGCSDPQISDVQDGETVDGEDIIHCPLGEMDSKGGENDLREDYLSSGPDMGTLDALEAGVVDLLGDLEEKEKAVMNDVLPQELSELSDYTRMTEVEEETAGGLHTPGGTSEQSPASAPLLTPMDKDKEECQDSATDHNGEELSKEHQDNIAEPLMLGEEEDLHPQQEVINLSAPWLQSEVDGHTFSRPHEASESTGELINVSPRVVEETERSGSPEKDLSGEDDNKGELQHSGGAWSQEAEDTSPTVSTTQVSSAQDEFLRATEESKDAEIGLGTHLKENATADQGGQGDIEEGEGQDKGEDGEDQTGDLQVKSRQKRRKMGSTRKVHWKHQDEMQSKGEGDLTGGQDSVAKLETTAETENSPGSLHVDLEQRNDAALDTSQDIQVDQSKTADDELITASVPAEGTSESSQSLNLFGGEEEVVTEALKGGMEMKDEGLDYDRKELVDEHLSNMTEPPTYLEKPAVEESEESEHVSVKDGGQTRSETRGKGGEDHGDDVQVQVEGDDATDLIEIPEESPSIMSSAVHVDVPAVVLQPAGVSSCEEVIVATSVALEAALPSLQNVEKGEEIQDQHGEGDHVALSQLDDSSKAAEIQRASSPSRRRKMGSTRKGFRSKNEDVHQKTEGVEGTEILKEEDQAEEQTERILDLTEKEPQLQQKQEEPGKEAPPSLQAIEAELQAVPEPNPGLPKEPTRSPGQEASPGVRRRKLGSNRKTDRHKLTGARDGGEVETLEEHREEPEGVDQTSEVGDRDKAPVSGVSLLASREPGPSKPEGPAGQQKVPTRPEPEDQRGQRSEQRQLLEDTRCSSYSVVMVGNSGVGKTSFMEMARSGTFSSDVCSSLGIDSCMRRLSVDGKPVVIQLWDTAGQERFHSITRQIFHRAQAFLLMYDITSSQSFSAVRYWADCIQAGATESVIILLVGNKCDSVDREVPRRDGENLAREYNFIFTECSAATGQNVGASLETLARMLSQKSVRQEEGVVLHKQPQSRTSRCC